MALTETTSNRTATAVTREIDDNLASVKLVMEGLQPVMFGDKRRAKNATVDVKLEPSGFAVSATVENPKGMFTVFKYRVRKLPSLIDVRQSRWKVKKDMIAMKLRKTSPNTWVPFLSGGLDQAPAGSDSEDDSPDKQEEQCEKVDDSPKK